MNYLICKLSSKNKIEVVETTTEKQVNEISFALKKAKKHLAYIRSLPSKTISERIFIDRMWKQKNEQMLKIPPFMKIDTIISCYGESSQTIILQIKPL